jgi:hypothetical protein
MFTDVAVLNRNKQYLDVLAAMEVVDAFALVTPVPVTIVQELVESFIIKQLT